MWMGILEIASNLIGAPIKAWQERKTLAVTQEFELQKLEHDADLA